MNREYRSFSGRSDSTVPLSGRMENKMRNDIKILIAGGDKRQIYCASRLALRYSTTISGFDCKALPMHLKPLSDPSPAPGLYDYAVLPMNALNSDGSVNTPYGCSLSAETIASAVKDNGIIFTGREDFLLRELFPEQKLVSYLTNEELLLKNAYLTAEGAVQIALEKLDTALSGLPVLIVGLGRIGTALSRILLGFSADITAAVRSPEAEAKAEMLGIRSVYTNKLSDDYALVFNTVPATVFTSENINVFNSDTLFIELASGTGGFDADSSSEIGMRLIRGNGLPGKTAPVTAGEIIADAISDIIERRGDSFDE